MVNSFQHLLWIQDSINTALYTELKKDSCNKKYLLKKRVFTLGYAKCIHIPRLSHVTIMTLDNYTEILEDKDRAIK